MAGASQPDSVSSDDSGYPSCQQPADGVNLSHHHLEHGLVCRGLLYLLKGTAPPSWTSDPSQDLPQLTLLANLRIDFWTGQFRHTGFRRAGASTYPKGSRFRIETDRLGSDAGDKFLQRAVVLVLRRSTSRTSTLLVWLLPHHGGRRTLPWEDLWRHRWNLKGGLVLRRHP